METRLCPKAPGGGCSKSPRAGIPAQLGLEDAKVGTVRIMFRSASTSMPSFFIAAASEKVSKKGRPRFRICKLALWPVIVLCVDLA